MRKLHAAVAAVFMLGAAGLFAAQMDDDTANFMKQTARDGKHEVAMGKMAADKATNPDVKKFAQTLVDDHTKANQELMDLAQRFNMDLSGTDFKEEHAKHADQFDKATGAAFDRAFMNWALEDHNKAVDSFQNYIKNGKNADVVAFAGRWLPGLKQHQQMARDLSDRISKGAFNDLDADNPSVSAREDLNQPVATSSETREFRSEQTAPVVSDERVSIRERNIDRPVVSERRTYRVEEPYSERGSFVSYDAECNTCETHCDSCDTCNTCGEFEDVMYDNDYRDGITHQIHIHAQRD
jgi:putative membrane protein